MKSRRPKYSFPPKALLEEVRRKLSHPDYEGSLALPDSATEVERAKYEISQMMIRYLMDHGLKQRELAAKLGIDEARVSQILKARLDGFTLDRLLGYAEKLHPGLRLKIIAA